MIMEYSFPNTSSLDVFITIITHILIRAVNSSYRLFLFNVYAYFVDDDHSFIIGQA